MLAANPLAPAAGSRRHVCGQLTHTSSVSAFGQVRAGTGTVFALSQAVVFRLTERIDADRLVLKLEGRGSAEALDDLVASWVGARLKAGGRPIWIDLTDVLHVDDVVLRQLARMHTAGARFIARGCLMHYVVRQITDQPASAE